MVRGLVTMYLLLPIIHFISENSSRVIQRRRYPSLVGITTRRTILLQTVVAISDQCRRVLSRIGQFVKNADVYQLIGDKDYVLAVNKNCARCTQILRDFTEAKTERENFHTGHEVVKLLVEKKSYIYFGRNLQPL